MKHLDAQRVERQQASTRAVRLGALRPWSCNAVGRAMPIPGFAPFGPTNTVHAGSAKYTGRLRRTRM
jgi:hypothetical protein